MAKEMTVKLSATQIDEFFLQAKQIVVDAGAFLLKSDAAKHVKKKGAVDLVTETDIAVNKILSTKLAAIHNEIDIVAEEGVPDDLQRSNSPYAWIIDPIDGTSNFVHNLQHSAISVALYDRTIEKSLIGIVYNPFRCELFTAVKDRGACLNDRSINVSSIDKLEDGLICSGFAYDRKTNPDNNLAEWKAMMMHCHDLRRSGAASLDLAYVAAGRFEGYFEQGLKPWDLAAGQLLITEAGGKISHYDGTALKENSRHILSSNSLLHSAIQNVIAKARAQAQMLPVPRD